MIRVQNIVIKLPLSSAKAEASSMGGHGRYPRREFVFVVFMKNLTYYTLSLSGGKDSVALFFKIIEVGIKLHEVVFVDLGDEFKAVYEVLRKIEDICRERKIKFTVLKILETTEYKVFLTKEVNKDFYNTFGRNMNMFEFYAFGHIKTSGEIGYSWCGKQRWGTAMKKQILNNYYQSLDKFIVEYVGIAADETHRIDITPHKNYAKAYPLIKWQMTEEQCLSYCYENDIRWEQNGVYLYDILDRVSCKHCQNKNLKELRNIWEYLPETWEEFKWWQKHTVYPYRSGGFTIEDLEKRFHSEAAGICRKSKRRYKAKMEFEQLSLFECTDL